MSASIQMRRLSEASGPALCACAPSPEASARRTTSFAPMHLMAAVSEATELPRL